MKTLIVDGQILQTNAFFRGMGGFTYNLARYFVEQSPDTRLIVLLNQNMLHDDKRVGLIADKMPTAELHYLDLPYQPGPDPALEMQAKSTIEAFIASHTTDEEVFYFIPALFLFDYCAVFPDNAKKLLLFHDLTPLIFRKDMAKYFPAHLYFPRFKAIFEADIVYTNSQTTARDLELYLGLSPKKMVTIDGSRNIIAPQPMEAANAKTLLKRLGIDRVDYLLMPTGGTEFKNNVRAAEALHALKEALSVDLKIVVTSFFRDNEKEELRLIAGDDLVFTGNITNSELAVLFQNCKAVLFPTLYEGLGLPVLEGIAQDKPVACSDIPVFREILHSNQALYMFDPYDVEAMTDAMLAAVSQAGFEKKRSFYSSILEKYSWECSARLFGEALNKSEFFTPPQPPKRRVAVVCPDPRKNNDVAVFAQRMHGYAMRAGVEFVYFIDPGGDDGIAALMLPDYVRNIALSYDISEVYKRLDEQHFDEVIHFLSSDVRFTQLMRAALSIPGYMYIGNEGYHETIEQLAQKQMISVRQYEVERKLYDIAKAAHGFETPSLFGGAKGVIVEMHVRKQVQKTLDAFELRLPLMEVPECSIVNFDAKALEIQKDIYNKVIDFIGVRK